MTAKMCKLYLSDKLGSYPSSGVHSSCCGCISKSCRSMTERVSYCVPYIRWALLICSSHCGWTGCDVCNYHIASPSTDHLLHLKPRLWVHPPSETLGMISVGPKLHGVCFSSATQSSCQRGATTDYSKLSPRVWVNSVEHPMCIGFSFHP